MRTTTNSTSREGCRSLSVLFVLAVQVIGAAANPAAPAAQLLELTDISAKILEGTDFNEVSSCADLLADVTEVEGTLQVDGDIFCEQPKIIRVTDDARDAVIYGRPNVHTKGVTFEIPEGKTMWFAADALTFEANEGQNDGIFLVDGNLVFYSMEYATYKAPLLSMLIDRNQLIRSGTGAIVHGQGDSVIRFTDSTITVVADTRKSAANAITRALAASPQNKETNDQHQQHHHQQVDSGFSSTTAGPPIKEANPDGVTTKESCLQQEQQESSPAPTTESSPSTAGASTEIKGCQHEDNANGQLRQGPQVDRATTPSSSTEPSSTNTGKMNFDDSQNKGHRPSSKGFNNNENGGRDDSDRGGDDRSGGEGGSGSGADESFSPQEMPRHPGQSLKVGEILTGFLPSPDQMYIIYTSRSDASVVFARTQHTGARKSYSGEAGSSPPPPGSTLIGAHPRKVARAQRIRADVLEEDQRNTKGAEDEAGEKKKGKVETVRGWLPFGKAGWRQTRAREHARQHMGQFALRITERGVLEGTLDGIVVFRKGGRSILGWRRKDPSYEAWVSEDGVDITRGGRVIWSLTADNF
eukprot:g14361.t1